MRTNRSAQRALGAATAVVLALAALGSASAYAAGGGKTAAACSNVTVDAGKYVGMLTLRPVLIGKVSCTKAHQLIRAYYRKMAAGQCGAANNFCNLQFAGGWDCSIFFSTESKETGGAVSGCARTTGAKVRMYKVKHAKKKPATVRIARAAGGRAASACSKQTVDGYVNGALGKVTVRFVRHGKVSCQEVHRTYRAYTRATLAGRCPSRICTQVTFAGGWTCSASSSVEVQELGAPDAGCRRRRASFDVYRVTGRTSRSSAVGTT